jgi:hypothetical protein
MAMARHLWNPLQNRWTLLFALLMSVLAATAHSQSTDADAISGPKRDADQKLQESTPPPAIEQKTENTPAATPEQLLQADIEAKTKKLYQLCAELRAEVAKTYKESLSLTVLKKAEEIEKLAKSLKVLMNKEAVTNN